MNLAELMELAAVLLILTGIAWLVGLFVPSPYGWPCGVLTLGAGLLLVAALTARHLRRMPKGVEVE